MPLTWHTRKSRLGSLLNNGGDEEEEALALDRLLHGQSVIGKTPKTTEIDALRFTDRDLDVVGTLEYGQFGVIDVVTCYLDGRVYVRKSIEKRFAMKTRDQCSPQTERDILLKSTKADSHWAPRLLCAFQSHTHLNLVMEYAEGGTLWDVLESSPHDGKVLEVDMKWWAPQIVSAINWCHSQGYAHRDIKPHNFVLTPTAHILLIDFGSAAPLLPSTADGSQRIPNKYCLVPCGTCDYISPEILAAHEKALVALEMADEEHEEKDDWNATRSKAENFEAGYGRETDWWSLGAMLYEMAYGVAPFFANDIRQTYLRIMDHETSLRFPRAIPISAAYEDLVRRLLTSSEERLGRRSVSEIMEHVFFEETNWSNLQEESSPQELHLPQFTYSTPTGPSGAPQAQSPSIEESHSQPFAFSALFLSSRGSSPGLSALHSTPSQKITRSAIREQAVASFIGFSWGPTHNAFPSSDPDPTEHQHTSPHIINTPGPLGLRSTQSTPYLKPYQVNNSIYPFATPMRATPHTLPRTSTVRRQSTAQRRTVSDREAMKQLVDCVGMSARKKVLESGRKPRVLTLPLGRSASGGLKKELRFGPPPHQNGANTRYDYEDDSELKESLRSEIGQTIEYPAGSEYSESEGPPSPSPSPRPGSAMSMLSRRSVTPTISASYSQRFGSTLTTSTNTHTLGPPTAKSHFRDNEPNTQLHSSVPILDVQQSYQDGRDFDIRSNAPKTLPSDQTFTTGTLDAMKYQHNSIMGDIEDMERRLEYLLMQVGG